MLVQSKVYLLFLHNESALNPEASGLHVLCAIAYTIWIGSDCIVCIYTLYVLLCTHRLTIRRIYQSDVPWDLFSLLMTSDDCKLTTVRQDKKYLEMVNHNIRGQLFRGAYDYQVCFIYDHNVTKKAQAEALGKHSAGTKPALTDLQ